MPGAEGGCGQGRPRRARSKGPVCQRVSSLTVSGTGDGRRTADGMLPGELGREPAAPAAHADVTIPADQPVDLDHEGSQRPVGRGLRRWFDAGGGPAALNECLQVGRGELCNAGAGAGEFAVV